MYIQKKQKKSVKGKAQTYHYLCQSYREGGKVNHRQIAKLGKTEKEVSRALTQLREDGIIPTDEKLEQLIERFDSDIWGTPESVLDLARLVFGGDIGLDPCTQSTNPTQAKAFFTSKDDGLAQDWIADSLWVNPPYSSPKPWLEKLVNEYQAGNINQAIVLAKAGTFQNKGTGQLCRTANAKLWWDGRMKFKALREGRESKSPDFDVVMAYWGYQPNLFLETFRPFAADAMLCSG